LVCSAGASAEVFNEYDPLKSKANDLELVFKGNIVASINL
jgi:hypothetical protein